MAIELLSLAIDPSTFVLGAGTGEAEANLYDFINILNSPEMYPDMNRAAYAMAWLMSAVSMILGVIGIIVLLLISIQVGIDLLMLTPIMRAAGTNPEGMLGRAQGFTSWKNNGADTPDDYLDYLTGHAWKVVIGLAVVGLMISGQALPVAGETAAVAGSIINKILNIDPSGKIDNLALGDTATWTKARITQTFDSELAAARVAFDRMNSLDPKSAEYKSTCTGYITAKGNITTLAGSTNNDSANKSTYVNESFYTDGPSACSATQ